MGHRGHVGGLQFPRLPHRSHCQPLLGGHTRRKGQQPFQRYRRPGTATHQKDRMELQQRDTGEMERSLWLHRPWCRRPHQQRIPLLHHHHRARSGDRLLLYAHGRRGRRGRHQGASQPTDAVGHLHQKPRQWAPRTDSGRHQLPLHARRREGKTHRPHQRRRQPHHTRRMDRTDPRWRLSQVGRPVDHDWRRGTAERRGGRQDFLDRKLEVALEDPSQQFSARHVVHSFRPLSPNRLLHRHRSHGSTCHTDRLHAA